MMNNRNIPNIPAEKFRFVADADRMHDQKFETKKIGYWRDAFGRFCRNKSSVLAAIIILCLILYGILVPIFCETNYSLSHNDNYYLYCDRYYPKLNFLKNWGVDFWDGAKNIELSQNNYNYFYAIGQETGHEIITKVKDVKVTTDGKTVYDARMDTYISKGFMLLTLTEEEYLDIQKWQKENNTQIIYPANADQKQKDANIWYKVNKKNIAELKDGQYVANYRTKGNDGDYDSLRIEGDPGLEDPAASNRYRYAYVTGTVDATSYNCRVFSYTYFQYKYGFEPSFVLGTNAKGFDMLTRLAHGARFSLIFAVCISAINLVIGAVYGAIEGYYGGTADMLMERFTDILSRVPFMVVTTLFQLHLAQKVGVIPSLLFAFVLTGWIGMASTVRMQFYRFKGQEYVLASRVLGASDWRIMFRHIFPNSLGTIITRSVLVIPGVIFSESSLTYLGIVNLDGPTTTSVGTLLANARDALSSDPYIILFPSLFISLLMICFNLFGNGLRDAFNPALRGVEE